MLRLRLTDVVMCLLIGSGVYNAWVGFVLNGGERFDAYQVDFLQFYTAGVVADRGQIDRLYDEPYFRALQRPGREQGLYSLYPPTMALAMAPLARLPYREALVAWWAIQAGCFLAAGAMLYRVMPFSRRWRINALLALGGMLPVWIAIGSGHLVPLLLAILCGGLMLHRRDRPAAAGLVLSALALKPQFAVGILLWLAVRRDVRALGGMLAGLAAQALAVSVFLGPGVCFDYLRAMPMITTIVRAFSYSPIFEQSFAGIASNLLRMRGYGYDLHTLPMRIIHIATAGAAAVLLCRVVFASRPWRGPTQSGDVRNYEYACAVMFPLLFSPYLLVYDLTLLAVALVFLWSSPQWRIGVALYLTMTAIAALAYLEMGFSVTGAAVLTTMFVLAAKCKGGVKGTVPFSSNKNGDGPQLPRGCPSFASAEITQ
jgi:hypothetical protein